MSRCPECGHDPGSDELETAYERLRDEIEAKKERLEAMGAGYSYLAFRVRRFHSLMGQVDPTKPVDEFDRAKRWRIMVEEFAETGAALVGAVEATDGWNRAMEKVRAKRGGAPGDAAEIADGVIDSQVTLAGTLLEMGLVDVPLIDAVMDANDAKVGGGRDANGKFTKPPGWIPPDIAGEIAKQRGEVPAVVLPENAWWDVSLPTPQAVSVHNRLMEARQRGDIDECDRLYQLRKSLGARPIAKKQG